MNKLLSILFLSLLFVPVTAFSQEGMFDASFSGDGKEIISLSGQSVYGWDILVLEDESILAGGNALSGGSWDLFLVKYLSGGSVDTLFADGGMLLIPNGSNGDSQLGGMLQQSDGKIMLSASIDGVPKIIRLHTNGSIDSTFGSNGMVNANPGSGYIFQQNNKFLLSGYHYDGFNNYYNFSRYNSDGTYDVSFGNNGVIHINPTNYRFDLIYSVKIQNDGKILIAGTSYDEATDQKPVLVRLNADGVLDASFGNNGVIIENLGAENMGIFTSVDILPDGKIITAGNMLYTNGSGGFHGNNPAIVKYHSNGTLDTDFGNSGNVIMNTFFNANDDIRSMHIQPDNKIIIGGQSGSAFPDIQSYFYVTRLNADGSTDYSYGINGSILTKFYDSETNTVTKIELQNDYKIIVTGLTRDTADNLFNTVVCRFNNDSTLNVPPIPPVNEDFIIYPNPAGDFLYCSSGNNTITEMNIYNALGEVVFSSKQIISDEPVYIGFLSSGIYFTELKTDSQRWMKTWMKE